MFKNHFNQVTKNCFFMTEAQCAAAADAECVEAHCESGYVLHDDEVCDNDDDVNDGDVMM